MNFSLEPWHIILFVLAIYLLLVTGIGVAATWRHRNTVDEYVNAERDLGFFVSYFLLGAAIFSSVSFLGSPGLAYSEGASVFWFLAYCSFSLCPLFIWGPKAMRLGRRFNYSTQAEYLAHRYNSRVLAIAVAVVTVIAMIQYIAMQMKGSGYVLNAITGGKVPFWMGALVAYLAVLVYVFFGGIRGVAWTNVFQGMFMISIAWFLGIYICMNVYGGVGPMFDKIIAADPDHLLIGHPRSHITHARFTSTLLVTILGFVMWPSMFMRLFNLRNGRVLRQTIAAYPTFAIFLIPLFLVGFAGIHFVTDSSDLAMLEAHPDRILPYFLRHLNFPAVIVGLFGAAALSAAMSTQDALTHTSATILAKDLYANLKKTPPGDTELMWCIRGSVVLFGAVAYSIAIFGGDTLVQLLSGAYGSVVQLAPMILASLYWKRATARGVLTGFLLGVSCNYLILYEVVPAHIMLDIHAGLWGLLVNIVTMIGASLLDQPPEAEYLAQFD